MRKDSELAMPEKDPTTYALITYLWIFVLSAWGGLVSFFNKVNKGQARRFNVTELIGELVTSAFVGVLTFWLCEWGNLPQLLTAAFVGVSGHMGSRALFKAEFLIELWVDKKLPGNSPVNEGTDHDHS